MILKSYLKKLNEQQFSHSIAASDIKGTYNNTWVNCYRTRCNPRGEELDKYIIDLCKSNCKQDAASKAISNLNSLKSKCSKATYPASCLKSISKKVESYNKKIDSEREKQNRINTKIAEFRRKVTGG